MHIFYSQNPTDLYTQNQNKQNQCTSISAKMVTHNADAIKINSPQNEMNQQWEMIENIIHPLFSQSYYLNQLKLIEIQQKIIKGLTLSSLKQNIIQIYDMFSSYENSFSNFSLQPVFTQIQLILKVMGKATLLALQHHYTQPNYLKKEQQKFPTIPDRTTYLKKLTKQQKNDPKFLKSKNHQKLMGICLYQENYDRNIEHSDDFPKGKNDEKKVLTLEEMRKIIDEQLFTEEDIRYSIQKQEMDYFIERRKKISNIVTNDNYETYLALEKQFSKVELEIKHFLSKYQLEFQFQNLNMINLETNSAITQFISDEKTAIKDRNDALKENYRKLLLNVSSKIKRVHSAYRQIHNQKRENLCEKYVQTVDKWSQIREYRLKLNEMEEKKVKYENLCREVEEKLHDFESNEFTKAMGLIKEYELKVVKFEKRNKILQQKVDYLTEISKMNGKDLFTIFSELSEKNKKYFLKVLGLNDSEHHSRQQIRRVSVKVDKFRGNRQRGSSVNSRNSLKSRQSSFIEEYDNNKQNFQEQLQPKEIQNSNKQLYSIKVSEVNSENFPVSLPNKNQNEGASENSWKVIKKKHRKSSVLKYEISHQNQDDQNISNLRQSYSTQKKLVSFTEHATENIPSIRILPDANEEKKQNYLKFSEAQQMNNAASSVRLTSYELDVDYPIEQQEFAEFPALKPGKVKKDKKKDKFEGRPRKIRESFEQCFQIESKSPLEKDLKQNVSIIQHSNKAESEITKKQKKRNITKKNSYSSIDSEKQSKSPLAFSLEPASKKPTNYRRTLSIMAPKTEQIEQSKIRKGGKAMSKTILFPTTNLNIFHEGQKNLQENKNKNEKYDRQMLPTLKPDQLEQKQEEKEIDSKQNRPVVSQQRKISEFIVPGQEEKIKKIAREVAGIDEFREKIELIHKGVCRSKYCSHIQKYLMNFQKYKKTYLRKRSMKLSIHNMQEQIR